MSKGLAVLRRVVDLVPGHLGARLSMARAFYSTGQANLANQALQVSLHGSLKLSMAIFAVHYTPYMFVILD